MVFEKISIVKGRKYKSLVRGYRDEKGAVRHKVIKYLGAVEPIQKRKENFNVGKKPTLKARELAEEERVFVEKSIKHSESFIKDRAKIIELSSQGNSVSQVCEKLEFDKKKVGEIINAFNKYGLKAFERKKNTGRPRRITKEQRAKIIEWLNTHPQKLDLHFNNWSRNKLSKFAKQNNIKISTSQIGRIIKQDEIKYKTKRSKMYSDDKNFLKNT
jgi:transposase